MGSVGRLNRWKSARRTDFFPELIRLLQRIIIKPRCGAVACFGVDCDFELYLAFVADGDVFDAAGFTKDGVVCVYALGDEVADAFAGGFFFDDADHEDFALKVRVFTCLLGSHNHSCQGTFSVDCTASINFTLLESERHVTCHGIHVTTEQNSRLAFTDNTDNVANHINANVKAHALHFGGDKVGGVLLFATRACKCLRG